jgi:hypothetical protein
MPVYVMVVTTDDDFSLKFKGSLYCDYEFKLTLNSPEDLDEIEVLGPYGADKRQAKAWEFEDAVKAIKENPSEEFSNTGGNRGVEWFVWEDAIRYECRHLPKEFADFVCEYAYENGHACGESEVRSIANDLAFGVEMALRAYNRRNGLSN